MEIVSIRCVSCGQGWTTAASYSIYEQQAQESCPCPGCGAYTLCCGESDEEPSRAMARSAERAF